MWLGWFLYRVIMGRRSSYFRHSLEAHDDSKMIDLLSERDGLALYGFFWIVLELYGRAVSNDDDGEIEQTISVQRLSNMCGIRHDRCLRKLILCQKKGLLAANVISQTKSKQTLCKLSIPNFMKYFGKYSKTEPVNCPNKRKEKQIKEKKRKEGNCGEEAAHDSAFELADQGLDRMATASEISEVFKGMSN